MKKVWVSLAGACLAVALASPASAKCISMGVWTNDSAGKWKCCSFPDRSYEPFSALLALLFGNGHWHVEFKMGGQESSPNARGWLACMVAATFWAMPSQAAL
jgi:hypothetical protein